MKSRVVLLVLAVLSLALLALTQDPAPDELTRPPRTLSHSPQRAKPDTAAVPAPSPVGDQQEMEAMRADLARMRTLLNQMRTNLAFVQTTDSPLKHQFDLNNEMWQMLVNDMERRLQKMQPGQTPKP